MFFGQDEVHPPEEWNVRILAGYWIDVRRFARYFDGQWPWPEAAVAAIRQRA
ncbi:MAG TPA: hypothetical protein VHC22_01985 [Pirellulales bacterium]|nr:hypothetical protein [Pirellulales bacterium]